MRDRRQALCGGAVVALVMALLLTAERGSAQPPRPVAPPQPATSLPIPPQPPPAPEPSVLQHYKPVTADRLKKPEDADWLMVRRTDDGWGYSPFAQVTPGNVTRLQPVWSFSTGMNNGHQAPPIVNNGVMFVATPGNQVMAIDAKTGDLLWRYEARVPRMPCWASRSAAASRCTATRCCSRSAKRYSWPSMPRPARRSGRRRSTENKNGYYMTLRRWSWTASSWSAYRAARSAIRGFVAAYDGDRQGGLADLHRTRAGRAGQRDLAAGRPMEDRRRLDLDDRQLRPETESRVLGHRQRRSLGGRSAAG